MFKEVKYDQPFTPNKRKSLYHQEFQLLHEFHGSDKRNMRLEYIANKDAHNAWQALDRYAKQTKTPVIISQRGNYVFVTRKEGEEQ